MKNLFGKVGVVLIILISFLTTACTSCASKNLEVIKTENVVVEQDTTKKDGVIVINTELVKKEAKLMRQTDSLKNIINTKESEVAVLKVSEAKYKKLNDSIVQSNKNLRMAIEHQNSIIKKLQKK